MLGVVPAAGEGTRLRPLTDDRPKGLVEVGGRPLLAYALDALWELGVDELAVVVGDRGDGIVDRFGDTYRGIRLEYAVQPEPTGLADAVLTVEPLVDGPFVVLNGDNVIDADLSRVLDRHRTAAAEATVLVEQVPRERAVETGVLRFDEAGALTGIVEKPDDPPSTWVTRGLSVLSSRVFEACRQVATAPTGEHELTAAIDRRLQAGATVETVPLEGACVNVNTPADRRRAVALLTNGAREDSGGLTGAGG